MYRKRNWLRCVFRDFLIHVQPASASAFGRRFLSSMFKIDLLIKNLAWLTHYAQRVSRYACLLAIKNQDFFIRKLLTLKLLNPWQNQNSNTLIKLNTRTKRRNSKNKTPRATSSSSKPRALPAENPANTIHQLARVAFAKSNPSRLHLPKGNSTARIGLTIGLELFAHVWPVKSTRPWHSLLPSLCEWFSIETIKPTSLQQAVNLPPKFQWLREGRHAIENILINLAILFCGFLTWQVKIKCFWFSLHAPGMPVGMATYVDLYRVPFALLWTRTVII